MIVSNIQKLCFFVFVTCMLGFHGVSAQSNVTTAIPNNESEFGPEFIQALNFAYETGLTKFKTVADFDPYTKITREQAASMIGKFAYSKLDFELDTTRNCAFKDVEEIDTTLFTKVMMSCHTGLVNGTGDGYILPKKDLSKAEGIAILIRMFKGKKLDETVDPRFQNYYDEAKAIGLTKEPNAMALQRAMTRYETILLLYRFNVKYELLNKFDDSKDDGKELGINMIANDIVYIDSQSFLDDDIDEIFAQIYGINYRLEKTSLLSQFDGAYTRYGNVYTNTEQSDGFFKEAYVGVATFNLINDIMIDGNIRPIELGDNYYTLKSSDIKPFYEINETVRSPDGNTNLQPNDTNDELQNQNGNTIYNPGYIEEDASFTE